MFWVRAGATPLSRRRSAEHLGHRAANAGERLLFAVMAAIALHEPRHRRRRESIWARGPASANPIASPSDATTPFDTYPRVASTRDPIELLDHGTRGCTDWGRPGQAHRHAVRQRRLRG